MKKLLSLIAILIFTTNLVSCGKDFDLESANDISYYSMSEFEADIEYLFDADNVLVDTGEIEFSKEHTSWDSYDLKISYYGNQDYYSVYSAKLSLESYIGKLESFLHKYADKDVYYYSGREEYESKLSLAKDFMNVLDNELSHMDQDDTDEENFSF